MNEEDFLRELPLRQPSEMLDQRVGQMLGSTRPRIMVRRVALWQCAAACAICVLLAFVAGIFLPARTQQQKPVSEVRWVLQVQQRPLNVYDWTQYPKSVAPCPVLQAENTDI